MPTFEPGPIHNKILNQLGGLVSLQTLVGADRFLYQNVEGEFFTIQFMVDGSRDPLRISHSKSGQPRYVMSWGIKRVEVENDDGLTEAFEELTGKATNF